MAWIAKNERLTVAEMQHNADILIAWFRAKGWTDNAIAGMLGNIQTESRCNPGAWENYTVPAEGVTKVGYGLVQWTPYTKYSEWAGDGWENNGTKQMERIIWELENHTQWYATEAFPMSFPEFTQSTDEPGQLAYAWMYNYERPASLDQPARATQAEEWYEYITAKQPVKEIPAWLLWRLAKGR